MSSLELKIIDDAGERVARIDTAHTSIGRGPDNDIVLLNNHVSRKHAAIQQAGTDFVIRDVGSASGTFVDGEEVHDDRVLKPGSRIALGGALIQVGLDETRRPPLQVLAGRGVVRIGAAEFTLPPKEFLGLLALAGRNGNVVSRDDFARAVWPEHKGEVSDEMIDQVIRRIRELVERAGTKDWYYVRTRRGRGFWCYDCQLLDERKIRQPRSTLRNP